MKTALVLSGGGARGAYEAGIISYLREELEPRLERPLTLDILCGTSVGAITASALAASATRPEEQGHELRAFWSGLSLKQVLQFGAGDLARTVWELGGGGLANPLGMRGVLGLIDWKSIGRNIRAGALDALSVCATRVSNGRSAVFVQQAEPASLRWFDNPHFDVVRTRIGPRHALASAAMPVLFAPVAIEGQLYLDGGLRMNVPVSPALHLGAQRVAVVSLQRAQHFSLGRRDEPLRPTVTFLAGKAMNALLQDRLEQDVENLRRINAMIEAGYDSFGPDFSATMNAALAAHRTSPMRYVRNLLMRPSRDLGAIASRFLRSREFRKRNPQIPGRLLTLLAGNESEESADLASYLLFDPGYVEELLALGRADARSHEAEWARFFDDTPCCEAEATELARPSAAGVAKAPGLRHPRPHLVAPLG